MNLYLVFGGPAALLVAGLVLLFVSKMKEARVAHEDETGFHFDE